MLASDREKTERLEESVLATDSPRLGPSETQKSVPKACTEKTEALRPFSTRKCPEGDPSFSSSVSSKPSLLVSSCLPRSSHAPAASPLSFSGPVSPFFPPSLGVHHRPTPRVQAMLLPSLIILLEAVAVFSKYHSLRRGDFPARLRRPDASRSLGRHLVTQPGVTSSLGSPRYLPVDEGQRNEKLWILREEKKVCGLQQVWVESEAMSTATAQDTGVRNSAASQLRDSFFFPTHFFVIAQDQLTLMAKNLLQKHLAVFHKELLVVSRQGSTSQAGSLISAIFKLLTTRRTYEVNEKEDLAKERGELERSCTRAELEEGEGQPLSGDEEQQTAMPWDAEVTWLLRGVQALAEAGWKGSGESDHLACVSWMLVLRWHARLAGATRKTRVGSEEGSGRKDSGVVPSSSKEVVGRRAPTEVHIPVPTSGSRASLSFLPDSPPPRQTASGGGAEAIASEETLLCPRDYVGYFEGVNRSSPADAVLSSPTYARSHPMGDVLPPEHGVFASLSRGEGRRENDPEQQEVRREYSEAEKQEKEVAEGDSGERREESAGRDGESPSSQCTLTEGRIQPRQEEGQRRGEIRLRRSTGGTQEARRRLTSGDEGVKKPVLTLLKTLLRETSLLLRVVRLQSDGEALPACFSLHTGLSSPPRSSSTLRSLVVLPPELLSSLTHLLSAAARAACLLPPPRRAAPFMSASSKRESAIHGKSSANSWISPSTTSVECLVDATSVAVSLDGGKRRSTSALRKYPSSVCGKRPGVEEDLLGPPSAITSDWPVGNSAQGRKYASGSEAEWDGFSMLREPAAPCDTELQAEVAELVNEVAAVAVTLFEDHGWLVMAERFFGDVGRRPRFSCSARQEHPLASCPPSRSRPPSTQSEAYQSIHHELRCSPCQAPTSASGSGALPSFFMPPFQSACSSLVSGGSCSPPACTVLCGNYISPAWWRSFVELLSLALRLALSAPGKPLQFSSASMRDFVELPSPSSSLAPSRAGQLSSWSRVVRGSSRGRFSSSNHASCTFCPGALLPPLFEHADPCLALDRLPSGLRTSIAQPFVIFLSFLLPQEALVRFPLWVLRLLTVARRVAEAELFFGFCTYQTKLGLTVSSSERGNGVDGRGSWAEGVDRSRAEESCNRKTNSRAQSLGLHASPTELDSRDETVQQEGDGGEPLGDENAGHAVYGTLVQHDGCLSDGHRSEASAVSREGVSHDAFSVSNSENMRGAREADREYWHDGMPPRDEKGETATEQTQLDVLLEKEVQLSVALLSLQRNEERKLRQPNRLQDCSEAIKTGSGKSARSLNDIDSGVETYRGERKFRCSNW